jgi:hypothetical protein
METTHLFPMRKTGTPAIKNPVCLYALCAVDLAIPRMLDACETETVTRFGSLRRSFALGFIRSDGSVMALFLASWYGRMCICTNTVCEYTMGLLDGYEENRTEANMD